MNFLIFCFAEIYLVYFSIKYDGMGYFAQGEVDRKIIKDIELLTVHN